MPKDAAPHTPDKGGARYPDWRWRQATDCLLSRGRNLVSDTTKDLYVELAKRVQALYEDLNTRRWMAMKWADVYQVVSMSIHPDRPYPAKTVLECYITAGTPKEEILGKLKWLTEPQYRLFTNWFFDVEPYRNSRELFDSYILYPLCAVKARITEAMALAQAFDGNLGDALMTATFGRVPEKYKLMEIMGAEHLKRIAGHILGPSTVDPVTAATFLEAGFSKEVDFIHAEQADLAKMASGTDMSEQYIENIQQATVTYADGSHTLGPGGEDPMIGFEGILKAKQVPETVIDVQSN